MINRWKWKINILNAVLIILMIDTAVLISLPLSMIIQKLPMQELKLTAVTATEIIDTTKIFEIADTEDFYYFEPIDAGEEVTAVIKFMAVENTSQKLFTSHGTGQYVYFGCSELCTKYDFISTGRYLHIRLTLMASQTDLKLEDGTPFDITRYSLKPVLSIER